MKVSRRLTRRPRSDSRILRRARATSAALALVVAAGLTWQASYAVFSDSTAPLVATVGAATLNLTDDDAAVRLFTATGLRPGVTQTRCIAVTSSGPPVTVRLYGTGRSSSNGLAGQLDLDVALGTGGSNRDCTGFRATSTAYTGTLAAFPTDSWTAGVGSWTTNGTATTRVYQVKYTLAADAPISVQNGRAAFSFVWESRTA